jgi:hypothetical protein
VTCSAAVCRHPQAGGLGDLFGGFVPLFFTPADYPDFMMPAGYRHPIFSENTLGSQMDFLREISSAKTGRRNENQDQLAAGKNKRHKAAATVESFI